ncbi:MAG: serine/threonine-protein kinase, partial [Thermoanaerobaculia bacterium]
MAKPETDETATQLMPFRRRPAVSVSDYRIVRKIGEGGMGEVYEAEQEKPIRRQVALKVIKRGMDSAAVIARFESERQALAVMDHPTIARIFDAGVTEGGRPFFAMELVDGVPVTDYCDDHRLATRERIELFIRICDGVHHAHQKGIIHCDLKPSNILLTVRDGRPVPKIIDFGIAKAAAQSLSESIVLTGPDQLIGTPEYMSPEQAETTVLDVDTRSDVYSLGVLLYRLLAGVLPFDSDELRQAGFDEARRKILEDEPPRPSTRLSDLESETTTRIARDRRSDPPTLVKRLRGDLDGIVMKALAKDRACRYDSASDFAADLSRHLDNQPVVARLPNKAYRLRKFVRRHRLGVAAASLVALALLLGVIGTALGLVRATRSEARARQEAETARQVAEFLAGMFESSDPFQSSESIETLTARQMLDRGAERLETELLDQPLIRAGLLDRVGSVYKNVAVFDRAEALLRQSLEIRERLLPPGDPDLARSVTNLGDLFSVQARYDDAEELFRRALEMRERHLGGEHPDLAESLHDLAKLLMEQGRFAESEPLYQRALAIREKAVGPEDDSVGAVLNDFGLLAWKQGNYAEAEKRLERCLAIREKTLGPDHPNLAAVINNMGVIYAVQEKYAAALPLFQRSLAIREKVLGPDHPRVADDLSNLASLYSVLDEHAEAEPLYRRALAIRESNFDGDHFSVAGDLCNLADL